MLRCVGLSDPRYTHMEPDRIVASAGPWTVEKLAEEFKRSLGTDLIPPRM